MRRLALVGSLALVACTTKNPLYEDSGGSEPPEGTTSEDEPEPEPEPECELHPPRPLAITVTVDGVPRGPECPDEGVEIVRFTLGPDAVEPDGGRLELLACEGDVEECGCPLEASESLVIDLGDDVELTEPLGSTVCARMELWTREGPDGCEWSGLLHYETALPFTLPDFIAANGLGMPPLSLFQGVELSLGLVDEEECTDLEPCESGYFPGRHALDVLGQEIVPVDAEPLPVDLVSSFDGSVTTYIFDNRESSVTLDCETRASWTAQRLQ